MQPLERRRRPLEGVTFVAVWIGLGVVLPVGRIGYLLLGVPLAIGFQLLVRRQSLGELLARKGAMGARDLRGKALVTALGLLVAASFVARDLATADPADANEWITTVWTVGALGIAFAVGYVVLRRALVALTLAAVVVGAAGWAVTPRLAAERSGDRQLLAQLAMFEGYQDLSIALVDLNASEQVRFANTGSTPTTRFEIGSVTKALTGLVIADAVKRGEVNLASPVSTYLPLKGSAAGAATMQQLVTHTSGYPDDSAATVRGYLWRMPLGLNPVSANLNQTLQQIRGVTLTNRGRFAYSNLGAAAAGQAAAAAAGMGYPDLMRTRLFEPMRMSDTAVQTTPMVAGGNGASGRPVQPWVMHGLAPEGGVVSTSKDLAILATAILNGAAPGLDALTGTTPTDSDNTTIGIFWGTSRQDSGQMITWKNGGTGGYSSYIGLDLKQKKAVIVLSDVARDVGGIGDQLLNNEGERPGRTCTTACTGGS